MQANSLSQRDVTLTFAQIEAVLYHMYHHLNSLPQFAVKGGDRPTFGQAELMKVAHKLVAAGVVNDTTENFMNYYTAMKNNSVEFFDKERSDEKKNDY